MSITLRVWTNGDHCCIVWKPNARIANCLGFAVHRKCNGSEEVLKNYVGFDPAPPGTAQPSTTWPFQRYLWWDYLAGVSADAVVSYRVVPVMGPKGNLKEAPEQASAWTDAAPVTEQRTPHISAYFNRGVVATQWVARALENVPGSSQHAKMTKVIADPKNSLRQELAGHLLIAMRKLLEEAAGPVYAALYELNDPELIAALTKLGKKANLVLANGAFSKKKPDENAEVRPELRSAINLFDRLVSSGHFAHNKFLVFCDEDGKPRKVWTGSTNWTVTGLCTQANNGLLVEDDAVAAAFKDEWDRVHRAGNGFPSALVKANSQPKNFEVDGSKVSVWFAPTDEQEDLHQARALINAAQEGILFLMFNPGGFQDDPERWTLLQSILNRHQPDANPDYDGSLYIHGVVNQPIPRLAEDPTVSASQPGPPAAHELDPAAAVHPVVLFQRGDTAPLRASQEVLVPAAIKEKFANWVPELKQESVAMVHSKVIVLDPFGKHPVVMTGSHNMGPKASAKNDDNLVIIENNPSLAQAYAVNIIAIYQNYQWRLYREQHTANVAWSHLEDEDTWQDGHLKGWRAPSWISGLARPPRQQPRREARGGPRPASRPRSRTRGTARNPGSTSSRPAARGERALRPPSVRFLIWARRRSILPQVYSAGKKENHGLHGWERRNRGRTNGIEVATGFLLIRAIRVIRGSLSCRRNIHLGAFGLPARAAGVTTATTRWQGIAREPGEGGTGERDAAAKGGGARQRRGTVPLHGGTGVVRERPVQARHVLLPRPGGPGSTPFSCDGWRIILMARRDWL